MMIGPASHKVRNHYLAASLSLPSLLAQIRCEYDSVINMEISGAGWNKPTIKNASNGCAALVERANVGSVEGLPGSPKAKDLRLAKGCDLLNVDEKHQLAVVECREGTGYADGEIFFTSSHEVKVFSMASNRAVLSIPLSHSWKGINGIVANTRNGDYLILTKEGIHIEVYRLAV